MFIQGDLIPRICNEIAKKLSSWCPLDHPLIYFKNFTTKVRSEIDEMVSDTTLKLALGYMHDKGEV